jgi:hypothetical protein
MVAKSNVAVKRDLPFDNYLSDPGTSQSMLQILRTGTPLHYYHSIQDAAKNSRTQTEAQAFGTLFHLLALTGEENVLKHYARVEGCSAITKQNKQCANEAKYWVDKVPLCGRHLNGVPDNIEAVSEDKYLTAESMVDSINNSNLPSKLLQSALPDDREISIFFDHPRFGIQCKARIDALSFSTGAIIDIKTTSTTIGDDEQLSKDIYFRGYHIQAAWYLMAARLAFPETEWKTCTLIFIEKTPPYISVLRPLDDEYLRLGEIEADSMVERLSKCIHDDKYPGPPEIDTIKPLDWMIRKFEDDFNVPSV